MAITQAIANSFKKELLDGDHDFTAAPSGDIFKIALYQSSAIILYPIQRSKDLICQWQDDQEFDDPHQYQ